MSFGHCGILALGAPSLVDIFSRPDSCQRPDPLSQKLFQLSHILIGRCESHMTIWPNQISCVACQSSGLGWLVPGERMNGQIPARGPILQSIGCNAVNVNLPVE